MSIGKARSFDQLFKTVYGLAVNAVAGTTPDNVEQDGAYVDTQGYDHVTLKLTVKAVLAEGETATINMNAQTDADGTGTGTDFGTAATAVVLTGGSGGSTETAIVEIPLNLVVSTALRYIRGQFTVDGSASGTDTWIACLDYILGGANKLPAV